MKQVHFEVTKEGQLKGEALLLKALKQKPGRFRMEIYTLNKRSLPQNNYLHVVFTLAQKGLYGAGYRHITTMQAAKDWFKARHLTVEAVNEQTGEVYKYVRHTSDLPKDEMAVFIDTVRDECLEFLGVYIPTPDEYRNNYSKWDLSTIAA